MYLEDNTFNPSEPTIRFIWPTAKTYMLFFGTVWFNNLNVEINGVKYTPANGIRFKEGFVVDVPLTSGRNRIECWITTVLIKKKFKIYTRIMDINLDPSFSYIMEIKNPVLFYMFGFIPLVRYRIKNIEGKVLFEG